jgi:hypothetical protein
MAKTYILIDGSGQATHIAERDIQRVASEYLASGEAFQIFKAEPMRLQLTLTPATGRAPVFAAATASGGRPAKRKKARRKKAGKRAKAAGRKKGTGKVGRPAINTGPCVVPGCGKPSKTRGLCSAHYQQHRRLVREGKPGLIEKSGAPTGAAPARKRRGRKKSAAKRTAAKKTASRKKAGRKKGGRKKAAGKKAPAAAASAAAS